MTSITVTHAAITAATVAATIAVTVAATAALIGLLQLYKHRTIG